MSLPRLKPLTCLADEGRLLVSLDPRARVELPDPSGQVRTLLELLSDGTRTPSELRVALTERWPEVSETEVGDALATLDGLGWLEDAAAAPLLSDYERERYFSNLAFFDAFTSLDRTREEIQRALLRSHVLLLGAGGLGSCVLQNLAGLGVGEVTLVDDDDVELRNFVRQFTYTEAQLGQPKVEHVAAWARELQLGDARERAEPPRHQSRDDRPAAGRRRPRGLRDRRARGRRPVGQRGPVCGPASQSSSVA